MSTLSLNLTQAMIPLSIYDLPPQEYPESGSHYRAESQASGGAMFQHGRRYRAASYYCNCLPVENGLASAGFTPSFNNPTVTFGELRKAAYVNNCGGSCPSLIGYDDCAINGYATSHFGTILLTSAGQVLRYADCKFHPVELKGLDLQSNCFVGLTSAEGHLIAYSKYTIYVSSAVDFLDFTPKMEYGASSFGVAVEIGEIISIVPYGRGMYVLGSRGGAYGACTGDIITPFRFEPVKNFNGIWHKNNCVAHYEADELYAYTKSGLQKLVNTSAISVFPDWSNSLRYGKWTSIFVNGEECHCTSDGLQPNKVVSGYDYEFNDTFLDECYRPLFEENSSDCNVEVMVSNLSPKYVTISYAIKTFPCHTEYCRLAVYDRVNERATVLHAKHTHVYPAGEENTEFSIVKNGKCFNLRLGEGAGYVLYNEFSNMQHTAQVVHAIRMFGKFNGTPLPSIDFVTGLDVLHSDCTNQMLLAKVSTREILYTGIFRFNSASFLVPFRGHLTQINIGR